MEPSTLLWTTLLLPCVGALAMALTASRGLTVIRLTALVTSLLVLLGAVVLLVQFPAEPDAGAFAVTDWPWLGEGASLNARCSVGLDGLSVWLYGLTALLVVTSILVSWEAIRDRPAGFYALLLMLETGMLGVFAARDLLLFYVFFEFTLIPLFFLIGIWGSEERRFAAIKFFLYTLAGSLFTFLGLLALVIWNAHHTTDGVLNFSIADLTSGLEVTPLPVEMQWLVFLALFAGFAIKVPLFPLHTWLPLAHVQAPTAGSVLLAGVLLKIGTYGFVRFSIPMLPAATAACMPWILALSVAGIVYGALVALAQGDIKRLIAYSSVSHLGYCMLGLFALNSLGVQGGTLQMINHGISTGGLFACVGMLYERYHTRQIRDLSGLAQRTPRLAFFMLVFTLSSIGMPGLNGFAGEFLVLQGMFQRAWTAPAAGQEALLLTIAVAAVTGLVLGAWYMLWLVQRVFFGPLREPRSTRDPVQDLCFREVAALAPLVVVAVWIGVQPHRFLKPMEGVLEGTIKQAAAVYEGGAGLAIDDNSAPSLSARTERGETRWALQE